MKNKMQDSKANNLPALQWEITELWTLSMEYGGHRPPQVPGGVHAQEARSHP